MNQKLSDPKKQLKSSRRSVCVPEALCGNFLIDAHVPGKNCKRKAGYYKRMTVFLEIGPGIGTDPGIWQKVQGQVIVEIDYQSAADPGRYIEGLLPNVKVINQDILKVDINELVRNITTEDLLKSGSESALLYYHTNYHGAVC